VVPTNANEQFALQQMNPNPNAFIFDTPEQVARAAAERFVDYSIASIREHGSFAVALAGGSTPRRAYELLGENEFKSRVDWSRVYLFFGDERMVPPSSPESNYHMVNEALLTRITIPTANVHRIIGETTPAASAVSYEAELRSFFGAVEWPLFDLVLLGMGADGHTASLFPGSAALKEETKWVVTTRQPQTGQDRISLTLPAINHAAAVLFLVTGKEKAHCLAKVFSAPKPQQPLPGQLINPETSLTTWLLDKLAASEL
jgi:6-phosphogluconolactonase